MKQDLGVLVRRVFELRALNIPHGFFFSGVVADDLVC
jgi:hypothetical protein